MLLAADESVWPRLSADEQRATMASHDAFDAAVRRHGSVVAGEALADSPTATTLRHADGQVVLTDGPFAETAEQVGGFYVVDLPDFDRMSEAAALLPDWYAVEIRPVVDPPTVR